MPFGRLQLGGDAFLSGTVLKGRFALRACIVNFHTALGDVEALPPLVAHLGREIDRGLRGETGHYMNRRIE